MRRFGIELEMYCPPSAAGNAERHANDIINGLGIRSRVAGYTGRDYTQFQCKHDGSLQPADRGVEIVSPIFPYHPDSFATITRVVTALDGQGYGINRRAGFHCHINVADLSMRERMLVVLKYAEHQAEISAMLPPSRRSNGYCSTLADRAGLERAINGNRTDWRPYNAAYPTRASESVNTAFMGAPGDSARLEFRQAAATTEAHKVIGWVNMLQELISEVVRRARLPLTWPGTVTAPSPFTRAPTPRANPLAQLPRMRPGTDMHNALMELCNTGVVTTTWAVEHGIAANVLRRIIVGFRRHGAGIRTVSGVPNMPEYHLSAVRAPCQPRDVFAPILAPAATPAPMPVAAPVAPVAVVPAAPPMTAAEFVRYPLTAGFSPATLAWQRDRADTFNADRSE